MTDFHTHILPDVDDGSRNLAESVRLLHELEERGFKSVVLTPHFYPQKETSEQMLEKRDGAFVLLKEKDDTRLELYMGCECYLHEYIFHAEDIRPFCIGNTNYLLTELSYRADAGEKMLEMIQKLITKYEIIPVLAHVERYPYIMNNKKMMEKFIESGCIGQTNLVSFCNIFVRGKLVKYIRDGYVRFLGTDTHREAVSEEKFKKASDYLTKNLGADWQSMFYTIEDIMNVK